MFEAEINGEKVGAEVSFYTAQLYEAEFKRDLIQDLFGIQTAEPSVEFNEIGDKPEDVQKFLDSPGDYIASVDFTKVSWNVVSKVLWAAIKTANPSAPGFMQWSKATKGVNLWLVQEQIGEEVSDCFFRTATAEEDLEREE